VESGKVDKAAHDAEPKSEQEKQAMEKAERTGKQRAKK
jgi:alkaline phosphatase